MRCARGASCESHGQTDVALWTGCREPRSRSNYGQAVARLPPQRLQKVCPHSGQGTIPM
jgi:hypothetical protein